MKYPRSKFPLAHDAGGFGKGYDTHLAPGHPEEECNTSSKKKKNAVRPSWEEVPEEETGHMRTQATGAYLVTQIWATLRAVTAGDSTPLPHL